MEINIIDSGKNAVKTYLKDKPFGNEAMHSKTEHHMFHRAYHVLLHISPHTYIHFVNKIPIAKEILTVGEAEVPGPRNMPASGHC